jgi:excisionase family DNA binding protein
MSIFNSPSYLTRQEAADYLGVKFHTLEVWACTGRYKIKYIKVGRSIRYKKEDLDAFIANRCVFGE